MKFKSTQRQALLNCVPSAFKKAKRVCQSASKGNLGDRKRLQEAVAIMARIYNKTEGQVVQAMYTGAIASHIDPPRREDDSVHQIEQRFWDRLDNLF